MSEKNIYFQHNDGVPEMIHDFLGREVFSSGGVNEWAKTVELKKEFLSKEDLAKALSAVGSGGEKMQGNQRLTADEWFDFHRVFYVPGRNLKKVPEEAWKETTKVAGQIDFRVQDHYPVMYRIVAWEKNGFLLERFPETLSHVNYGTGEENPERTQEFMRVLSRAIWGKDRVLFLPIPEGKELTIVSGEGYKDQLSFTEEKRGILLKYAKSADDFAEQAEADARKYRARASKIREEIMAIVE